ncbi:hypothetical protein TNCV_3995191 [Trichonephila clavipes]|nr:hypothetical protein TNCV_3995191 [Trichonephila clavipes]
MSLRTLGVKRLKHVKFVVALSHQFGMDAWRVGCQLKCHLRHLTSSQNYEGPSCCFKWGVYKHLLTEFVNAYNLRIFQTGCVSNTITPGWALSRSRLTGGPPRHFEVTAFTKT